MAPITRRSTFPKVIIERDADSEESSSDDEGEDSETLEEEQENRVAESGNAEKIEVGLDTKRKGKAPITISLKKVCKVSTVLLCSL